MGRKAKVEEAVTTLVPEFYPIALAYADAVDTGGSRTLSLATAVRQTYHLFIAVFKSRGGFEKLAEDPQCLPHDRSILSFMRKPEAAAPGFTPLSLEKTFEAMCPTLPDTTDEPAGESEPDGEDQ